MRVTNVREPGAPAFEWSDETNGMELAGTTIVARVGFQQGGFRGGAMQVIGGAPAIVNDGNIIWFRSTSQAAGQGVARAFAIPLHVPGAAFGGVVPRERRSWRFEVIVRADGLAATGAFINIAPNINSLAVGAQAGAEWFAATGLNGGAWTPRYRRIAADALTVGASSGVVAGADEHRLGFLYVEGPVPTLQWLLDGVVRHQQSNVAGLTDALSVGLNLRPQYGTEAGAVGTFLDARDSTVQVFIP